MPAIELFYLSKRISMQHDRSASDRLSEENFEIMDYNK